MSSGISWWSTVIHETPKTSTHVPLTNITTKSPTADSGTASAAEGSASGRTHSVPASRGRAGRHRVMASAPSSVPAPNPASAVPQGPGPPRCSSATSGPYTASAAPTTALTTANWSTTDHSHERPITSCQPSRRSRRSETLSPSRRGIFSTSSSARSAPAAAKAAASTARTQPGPMTATSAPPSAAPPIPAPCIATR
ncbi:hypothetical protein GA0115246_108066 [Streptomyces sp. SolWspMP-sol7th]|nr:hypothetical protein GA0115246_108066 [Streptomyces sp. SolWspMP-sol7th]